MPDLRGFGDSGLRRTASTTWRRTHATCTRSCTTCSATSAARPRAATSAASSIQDLGLRFDGFVDRQCLFNTVLPLLPDDYDAAGIPPRSRARRARRPTTSSARDATPTRSPPSSTRPTTPAPLHRASSTGTASGPRRARSTPDDVDFMTEPFADARQAARRLGRLRVARMGTRPLSEPPRLLRDERRADARALRPRGPRDPARLPASAARSRSPSRIGPFVVPGAGHFLQWEQAGILNRALVYFFADLRA